MADKDLGTSFTDFLTDLVGGNSNVAMNGNAAALGFNPKDPNIISQIAAAIQKSKDNIGMASDSGDFGSTLGDPVKAKLALLQHQQLLSSLNDFYSKKFGSTTK